MLEGPDLAGKTTLAKQLVKMMRGGEIVHRGPPTSQDPFVEYLRPLEEMYYAERWAVLDRWHWGEMIYGPRLRGGTIIDPVQHEYLEMACMRYGVSRLLLVPPMRLLRERFEARGDDLIGLNDLYSVADSYQHLALDPNYSVHRFIEQGTTISRRDASWMLAEAMGYRSRANLFITTPSFVGPTRPAVLFIGEKPAESHRGEFKTAFVPYRGTSGYHMLKCLRAVNARTELSPQDPWRAYAFVNAYEGCDDLMWLWRMLEQPIVVTLGRKAWEAVGRFNVVTGRAPHPQYARRFHGARVESYGEALLAAVGGKDMSKWKG